MRRRKFLTTTIKSTAGVAFGTPLLLNNCNSIRNTNKYNVLFIAVDDLRPQLGCYGYHNMHTPNIDAISQAGIQFNQHYVQAPTCGASRYALLTSFRLHPSIPESYGNNAFELMPKTIDGNSPVSLPHHFRNNGYYTVSIGKISHSPDGRNHGGSISQEGGDGQPEVPFSWDEVYAPTGEWGTAWDAFFAYAGGRSRIIDETPAYEATDVPDTGYPDGLIAEEAVEKLKDLKNRNQPFFFSLGFYKPHLPFNSPKKYWDKFDEESINLAPFRKPPSGIDPSLSLHRSGELTPRYTGIELAPNNVPYKLVIDSERKLRHAYFAAVHYVDSQIGKVIQALRDNNLYNNTIVVLWGDHGWHLGDHGIWGKHTVFERSLNSPLIMRVPNNPNSGSKTNSIVETIDIYPTLSELCGLNIPDKLHGESFAEILNNTDHERKEKAYGYWRRGDVWAKSFRNERYRFTRWTDDEGKIVQIELYDHLSDPNETKNISNENQELVDEFLSSMDEDWENSE